MSSQLHSSRDVLSLTVLALLREQPRHPYEIQRVIRQRHKEFAMGKPRALYHAVEQLVRLGAIEPIETSRDGKRPERTVYQITEIGREDFESWLCELLENPTQEYPPFTAAVNFMSHLPIAAVVDSLQGRIVALESGIAAIDAALKSLTTSMKLPRIFLIDHEYLRALRQAEVEWVRSLVEDLQSGRLTWNDDNPWLGVEPESRGEKV